LIDQSVLLGLKAQAICVLPTQSGLTVDSPASRFARQLAESLNTKGCASFIDPQRFEEGYGKQGIAQTPIDHPASLLLNAWLNEYECKQKYVVYDTTPYVVEDGRLSPWAQRCVENADIILLVSEEGESSIPGEVETCLLSSETRARIELVLLHPDDCRVPSGTAAWLAADRKGIKPFQAHHHVRSGNSRDINRLARRIIGKPVGLTLGGGGARGWAHIGVLRAMEYAHIEIDWVGGASMGSIIAAAYALDMTSSQLGELAARFSNPKKLLDFTFPFASLTATRRITEIFQDVCAGADIEDTWRPFYCVSANLTKGEENTYLTGELWRAIRTSMAFPAVFAPMLEDGCVMIDGGAANNVPVDRMRELCPTGTVIGVNLVTSSPVNQSYQFGPYLSGWQALISRYTPFAKQIKAPNVFDIMAGLVYSNNCYRLNETKDCANLIINVPVEAYGLLDFDKYSEIIDLGYIAAQEQLKDFKYDQ
jgi:predicted acylesterase/phospholipase RssA